ncbi:unnamed protein product [Brassica rapa subsp. narinosa]
MSINLLKNINYSDIFKVLCRTWRGVFEDSMVNWEQEEELSRFGGMFSGQRMLSMVLILPWKNMLSRFHHKEVC